MSCDEVLEGFVRSLKSRIKVTNGKVSFFRATAINQTTGYLTIFEDIMTDYLKIPTGSTNHQYQDKNEVIDLITCNV